MHHMMETIGQYGIALVIANVLLDQIGLPVPAVPTLIVAGALSAGGRCTAAAVSRIGDRLPRGRLRLVPHRQKYGIRVLKILCRISLEPDSCVSQPRPASSAGASIR